MVVRSYKRLAPIRVFRILHSNNSLSGGESAFHATGRCIAPPTTRPWYPSKRISVSKPYVSVQQSNDHPAQQRGLPCSIIIQEQREAIFPSGNGAAKSGVGVEGGERLHNGQRRRRRRRNVTGSDRLHQHIAPPAASDSHGGALVA